MLHSAATLVILNRNGSFAPFVFQVISSAEAIFFAGGDQNTYYNNWRDSPVTQCVMARSQKPVPIGGKLACACRRNVEIARGADRLRNVQEQVPDWHRLATGCTQPSTAACSAAKRCATPIDVRFRSPEVRPATGGVLCHLETAKCERNFSIKPSLLDPHRLPLYISRFLLVSVAQRYHHRHALHSTRAHGTFGDISGSPSGGWKFYDCARHWG